MAYSFGYRECALIGKTVYEVNIVNLIFGNGSVRRFACQNTAVNANFFNGINIIFDNFVNRVGCSFRYAGYPHGFARFNFKGQLAS